MIPVRAADADAEALGTMHVQAWRETYAGLMPDAVLATLDPAQRAARWRRTIGEGAPVFVARDADGAIVGFVGTCRQRDAGLPYAAEISSLYVLRRAQRRGLGRFLMDAAARALAAGGDAGVALWVLDGNWPARHFYAALGGLEVATKTVEAEGCTLHDTAYAWDDLTRLFRTRPA